MPPIDRTVSSRTVNSTSQPLQSGYVQQEQQQSPTASIFRNTSFSISVLMLKVVLKVLCVFSGIFALFALAAVVRLRGEWHPNAAGHRQLAVAAAMLAFFGFFCVSSFVLARSSFVLPHYMRRAHDACSAAWVRRRERRRFAAQCKRPPMKSRLMRALGMLAVTGVLLLFGFVWFLKATMDEQNTVVDSQGHKLTIDLPGSVSSPVEWMRNDWVSVGNEVAAEVYNSVTPAYRACTDQDLKKDIDSTQCSIVLSDRCSPQVRFIRFVARSGDTDSGVTMAERPIQST